MRIFGRFVFGNGGNWRAFFDSDFLPNLYCYYWWISSVATLCLVVYESNLAQDPVFKCVYTFEIGIIDWLPCDGLSRELGDWLGLEVDLPA